MAPKTGRRRRRRRRRSVKRRRRRRRWSETPQLRSQLEVVSGIMDENGSKREETQKEEKEERGRNIFYAVFKGERKIYHLKRKKKEKGNKKKSGKWSSTSIHSDWSRRIWTLEEKKKGWQCNRSQAAGCPNECQRCNCKTPQRNEDTSRWYRSMFGCSDCFCEVQVEMFLKSSNKRMS